MDGARARGAASLAETWIPVGTPGFAGDGEAPLARAARWALRERTGGGIATSSAAGSCRSREAILEYEASYRQYLRDRPALVRFSSSVRQRLRRPGRERPRRRVRPAAHGAEPLPGHRRPPGDRGAGRRPRVAVGPRHAAGRGRPGRRRDGTDPPRAARPRVPGRAPAARSGSPTRRATRSARRSSRPTTPPARDGPGGRRVVPREGCGHLSVEAFWQSSKVIEVRYDRFLALGERRASPLAGL